MDMGRVVAIVALVCALLGGAGGYAVGTGHVAMVGRADAADTCQTFPETGKTVCGVFLLYWRDHGGLAQQGLPLSGELQERSTVDGKIYRVQYFERAVFEYHPENQPPYDVLLSLLGSAQYQARYGGPASAPPANIGQIISFSGVVSGTGSFSQPMRAQLLDVKDNATIVRNGQVLKPRGKYVAVFLRASNLGRTAGRVYPAAILLADKADRAAGYDFLATTAAAEQYNLSTYGKDIEPGLSDDQVWVFDVQPDATDFRLVVASGFQPK
jgi:hypothetical protein